MFLHTLNTISSGSYRYNKHKSNQGLTDSGKAEQIVIKGILHNQPYAKINDPDFRFKNKLFQKIYEQNLKLNEIDDKLDETELQEIAPLRITDNKLLSPQDQAIQWNEYYIGLRIAALEQELKVADITKVTSLKQKIFKLDQERKSVKQNLEEK